MNTKRNDVIKRVTGQSQVQTSTTNNNIVTKDRVSAYTQSSIYTQQTNSTTKSQH